MKIFILLFAVVTLAITSCAQEQKKTGITVHPGNSNQATAVKIKIPVDGMVCGACQSTVKKAVRSLDGIKDVDISLENKTALVTYYPNLIKPERIQKAINDKGYTAGKPQEMKQ